MASACVNNIALSPENILDCAPARFPSYEWLNPRISSTGEFPDEDATKTAVATCSVKTRAVLENTVAAEKHEDADLKIFGEDFEFRLEDPVIMLPADELFCDGKIVPLQFSAVHQPITSAPVLSENKSLDAPKFRRTNEISSTDPYLFSPKAPRCSSRWKEFLGLKKLYQNSKAKQEDRQTPPSLSSNFGNRNSARGLKNLIQRNTKSSLSASIDSSLSLPLLKELDNESASISSRLSLSSSSSSHDHDDVPRLSLDSDKPRTITRTTHKTTRSITRARVVKHRSLSSENPTSTRVGRNSMRKASESTIPASGISVDSPRMNPSGKIVFHSLERSSSSPSSLNGGSRYNKHRGIERSYSANLRVTPVLNVPVCTLRGSSKSVVFGFPLFSAQQKKEGGIIGGGNRTQHNLCKNRTDRTSREYFLPGNI